MKEAALQLVAVGLLIGFLWWIAGPITEHVLATLP